VCSEGACASTCASGLAQCGRVCANLDTDLLNCGDCGVACRQGQQCEDGSCVGEATNDGSVATPIEEPAAESKDSDGCGCRQASNPRGQFGFGAAGVLLLAAFWRRRRKIVS
jgi:MYXO-CTERM domain-containing protein